MDKEFTEIHELLKSGDYDTVIYPSDDNGDWPGSGPNNIFTVSPDVIAEIMRRLQELKKFPRGGRQVKDFLHHRFRTIRFQIPDFKINTLNVDISLRQTIDILCRNTIERNAWKNICFHKKFHLWYKINSRKQFHFHNLVGLSY